MTRTKEEVLKATRVVLENLQKMKMIEKEFGDHEKEWNKIADLACELDALIKVYVK